MLANLGQCKVHVLVFLPVYHVTWIFKGQKLMPHWGFISNCAWPISARTGGKAMVLRGVKHDIMLMIPSYDLCKTWQESQMIAAKQPTSQISKVSTFLRLGWLLIMIHPQNMPLHWNPGHLGFRMVPSPLNANLLDALVAPFDGSWACDAVRSVENTATPPLETPFKGGVLKSFCTKLVGGRGKTKARLLGSGKDKEDVGWVDT